MNLESYIIKDDETSHQFADLLLKQPAEGLMFKSHL